MDLKGEMWCWTELELNIVTMVYDVMSVWFVRMLSVVYMHVETI